MIVQCSQCQTRFKIPDSKVTERGVKVRCTRCQHTFRVSRSSPAEEPQAPAAELVPVPPPSRTTDPGDDGLLAPPPDPGPPPERALPRPPPVVAAQRNVPRPPTLPPTPTGRTSGGGTGRPDAPTGGAVVPGPFGVAAPSLEEGPFGAPSARFGEGLEPPRTPHLPPPLSEDILEVSSAGGGAAAAARLPLLQQTGSVTGANLTVAPAPPARAEGALAVNALLAALLLAVLGAVALAGAGEGGLSLETLRTAGVLPASDRTVVARDVSNGLYDTPEGRPVFYVRGEVENRGASPIRVQVRVEILDGAQRLRSGVGLAGASATPEELAALATPQDGEALRSRLDARARVLAPGERAPFLVAFVEYPPHLGRARLQVTAEPEAPVGSAAREAP